MYNLYIYEKQMTEKRRQRSEELLQIKQKEKRKNQIKKLFQIIVKEWIILFNLFVKNQ